MIEPVALDDLPPPPPKPRPKAGGAPAVALDDLPDPGRSFVAERHVSFWDRPITAIAQGIGNMFVDKPQGMQVSPQGVARGALEHHTTTALEAEAMRAQGLQPDAGDVVFNREQAKRLPAPPIDPEALAALWRSVDTQARTGEAQARERERLAGVPEVLRPLVGAGRSAGDQLTSAALYGGSLLGGGDDTRAALEGQAEQAQARQQGRDQNNGGLGRVTEAAGSTVLAMLATPGGAGAKILQAALTQGGQSYQDAKAAGLSDDEARDYAAKQAIAEAVPAALFSAAGHGGVERAVSELKPIGGRGLRDRTSNLVRDVGKTVLEEQPEEIATTLAQQQLQTQIDPNAMDNPALANALAQTVAQTAMAGGMAHLPHVAGSVLQSIAPAPAARAEDLPAPPPEIAPQAPPGVLDQLTAKDIQELWASEQRAKLAPRAPVSPERARARTDAELRDAGFKRAPISPGAAPAQTISPEMLAEIQRITGDAPQESNALPDPVLGPAQPTSPVPDAVPAPAQPAAPRELAPAQPARDATELPPPPAAQPQPEQSEPVDAVPSTTNRDRPVFQTPNGPRRVSVTTRATDDGGAEIQRIKLHDDKSGMYESFNAPPNRFSSMDEAEDAGFRMVQERYGQAQIEAGEKPQPNLASKVDQAAAEAHTAPSEAQKEAGNFQKGHVTIHGMDIALENAKGSERKGVDGNGKPWSVTLPAHYGYVKGTTGADGDHVDVYVGPNPQSAAVYVIDQIDTKTGKFDEHKAMMGFRSRTEAEQAYDAAFSDGKGPQRRGAMTKMPVATFRKWSKSRAAKKPLRWKEGADVPGTRATATEQPTPESAPAPEAVREPDVLKVDAVHPKAEVAEIVQGGAPAPDALTYEQFKQQMQSALTQGNGYIGQAGEKVTAERMADLEEQNPEHAKRLDEESNAAPARSPAESPEQMAQRLNEQLRSGLPVHTSKVRGARAAAIIQQVMNRFGMKHEDAAKVVGPIVFPELGGPAKNPPITQPSADTQAPPLSGPGSDRTTNSRASEASSGASPEAAPTGDATTHTKALAERLRDLMVKGDKITWQQLAKLADEAYGSSKGQGGHTAQDEWEALQLAINLYALDRGKAGDLDPAASADSARKAIEDLDALMTRVPTQTTRTEQQQAFQQFSTPPAYAYLANWLANVRSGEIYLEPNIGTGSLAVFGANAGAQVIGNELDPRRAELVRRVLGIPVTPENTDNLHAILAGKQIGGIPVQPTVVVMNPPFSATAGRTDKRDLLVGANHITQALRLLQPGGRLVAIVGEGMSFQAKTYASWWRQTKGGFQVRANVHVAGKVYGKFGTTFPTRLLVIDKPASLPFSASIPIEGSVESLPDAVTLLAGIRDARDASPDRSSEPAPAQPGEPGRAAPSPERPAAPSEPARTEPGAVGPAERRPAVEPGAPERQAGLEQPARPGAQPATSAAVRTDGDAGRVGPSGESGRPGESGPRGSEPADPGRTSGSPADAGLRVSQSESSPVEDQGDTYATYRPSVTVPGAKPHPADLVESQAMASVRAPATTYSPNLAEGIVTGGKLSGAQLEQVVRAGQAHSETLPGGARQGYFVGDGTGVGKGRTIGGVIMDNWNSGRKRAVWISKNGKLFQDAIRDWSGLGGSQEDVFKVGSVKASKAIERKEGIAFMTYATLRQGSNVQKQAAAPPEGDPGKPKDAALAGRLKQLVDWLGKDYDGVIAFDEAHGMGNAVEVKGKRGKKKPSAQALAGVELQKALPNARILYVSATGATEVANLSYAERLGLWGEGTGFANVHEFVDKISGAGIAAMEVIARDLKALGKYLARSISFQGVKYDRVTQEMTPDQVEIYNELARAWQNVLRNINEALAQTGADKNPNAKSAAKSAFWGSHQRFFNQVLTGMQMPAVLRALEQDLEAGRAPVIQLVNTNEAALKRALAARAGKAANDEDDEGDDLDSLDLTPRDMLKQMLEHSFPTVQYETSTDENGNESAAPVKDSAGNLVHNPAAMAMKADLLSKLDQIRTPDGPMEQLLSNFGPDQVAEVTGRSTRLVPKQQPDGSFKTVQESRSEAKARAEAKDFQDDKRKILVFSDAGGTGSSYHADRGAKNQRVRRHYVLQPGWRADAALQGLGRTHRTNQKQPPEFVLVSTNLKAQKRFISSIARRLDQLGALTKGQRQAGSGGLFSAADNLESEYAELALDSFVRDLGRGEIAGMTMAEFEDQTGLVLQDSKTGKVNTPEIPQFLNRMLSLTTDMQDKVFDAFEARLVKIVQQAQEDGTLDTGLETLRADKIEEVSSRPVHTDTRSGAQTTYHELKVSHRFTPTAWDDGMRMATAGADAGQRPFPYTNPKSGRVYLFARSGTSTRKDGRVEASYRKYSPQGGYVGRVPGSEMPDLNEGYASEAAAQKAWGDEVAKAPEFRTETRHFIAGALLPVWDRLPAGLAKVFRAGLTDGRSILGREIEAGQIDEVMRNMGVDSPASQLTPDAVRNQVLAGDTAVLANGWKLRRVRAGNEDRIELTGKTSSRELEAWGDKLRAAGIIAEHKNFRWHYYVPTEAGKARAAIKRITDGRPVTRMVGPEETTVHGAPGAEPSGIEDAPTVQASTRHGADMKTVMPEDRIQTAPLAPGDGPIKKLGDITLDLGEALTAAGVGRTAFTHAGMKAKNKGEYDPTSGRTSIQAGNLDLAAHEISHRLDDFFGYTDRPESTAPAAERKMWVDSMKQTKRWDGFGSTPPTGISRSAKVAYFRAEGWAEFMRAYLVNPEKTRAIAPAAVRMLEHKTPPAVLEALHQFSTELRQFAGRQPDERTQANVRGIADASAAEVGKTGLGGALRRFAAMFTPGKSKGRSAELPELSGSKLGVGISDKAQAELFDSMWYALKAYRTAQDIQAKGKPPIDKDFETLARIQAGFADRMDSQFLDGLTDPENAPIIDAKTGDRMTLEWLLQPADRTSADAMSADLDAAMAMGVEERTVEEGNRLLNKARQDAEQYRQQLVDLGDPDAQQKAFFIQKELEKQAHAKAARLTGIGGGLTSDFEQAKKAAERRRAKDPEAFTRHQELLRRYRAWANANLDYSVAAGVMSQERADGLKRTHEHYVDLHRVVDEEHRAVPTQAFKGSSRLIDNPLVNLMHATWSIQEWANQNRVRKSFTDLLETPRSMHQGAVKDLYHIGHRVTEEDVAAAIAGKVDGKRPYKVWNKGEPEFWVFDPSVEWSFEAARKTGGDHYVTAILKGLRGMTQQTITKAPPFLIRQVFRDTVSRLVTTEVGSTLGDLFKGYSADLGGKPVHERYKVSGSGQGGWQERGKAAYQRRLMESLYDSTHSRNRAAVLMAQTGKLYGWLAEQSDMANRRAEFVRSWRKAKADGMTDYQADLYAASNARGLMDFAISGRTVKAINEYIVFFNAGMQAMRRAARSLNREHWPATVVQWGVKVAVPTAMLYLLQEALMSDEDREEWRQRPHEKRDFHWSFKIAPNFWIDIPKPYEWGVLASGLERVLDQAYGHDHAWEGYGSSMASALIPVKADIIAGSLRPLLEVATNYSFFTGRHIVSTFEENKDLDLRKGTVNASPLGQFLQKATGVDSRKIDHLIQGMFGGFGRIATARSGDAGWWAGATTGLTGRSPAWEARDVQWVMDEAEGRGVGSRKAFTILRDKLKASSQATSPLIRDQKAQEAREYATRLRERMEKNPKAFKAAE